MLHIFYSVLQNVFTDGANSIDQYSRLSYNRIRNNQNRNIDCLVAWREKDNAEQVTAWCYQNLVSLNVWEWNAILLYSKETGERHTTEILLKYWGTSTSFITDLRIMILIIIMSIKWMDFFLFQNCGLCYWAVGYEKALSLCMIWSLIIKGMRRWINTVPNENLR